jgi:superfamily II DNA or RNA helicase
MSLADKVKRAHELCDRIEHFSDLLRRHQRATLQMLRGVADGMGGAGWPYMTQPGYIVEEIVPGGGKSWSAVMAASVLVGSGLFDVAVWISPRITLVEQAKEDFASTALAMRARGQAVAIFNPAGLIPKHVEQARDFFKSDVKAWVLPYQKLRGVGDFLSQLVESRNVLLIFDEFQLLRDIQSRRDEMAEGPEGWFDLLDPLTTICYQKTGLGGFILSGGLFRNDGRRLPRISYRQGDVGRGEDPKRAYALSDIAYTLSEAQEDQCIIKIDFDFYGGEVEFAARDVDRQFQELSRLSDELYDQKLRHFLDEPDVWQTIINDMLESLDFYNPPGHGYRARYMVTSKSIEDAELHKKFLEGKGRRPLLIHSKQSDSERKQLNTFRRGEGNWDGLVSVAMGYIGLSVPDLSHMAYLSHYRSAAWINQAFHRVTRKDNHPRAPEYRHQLARIFLPNDPAMRDLANHIMQCQNPGVAAMPKPLPIIYTLPPGAGREPIDFEGFSASISGREFSTNGQDCTEHNFIDDAVRSFPALNAIPRRVVEQFKDFSDRYGK